MHQLSPPIDPTPPPPLRRLWALTALVASILALSFLLQVQTGKVADWQEFAFYDPGTVLKGDLLLAKGYIPTIDFGYTHGLLSLLYGRLGFAILGRTPWAFLILTLLTQAVMAWALVRILLGAGVSRKGWLVFLPALPLAIMPAYLTLTHPLEAMLILLALADQVNGRRSRALALTTVCLFVKPSMAYVYGAVQLILILLDNWKPDETALPSENPKRKIHWPHITLTLLPAAATFAFLFLALSLWVGTQPVIHTLLPLTGAKTYAVTGFGFFSQSGRDFWLPQHPIDYLISSVGIYLIAALASALGAIWAAWRLTGHGSGNLAERPKLAHAYELLLLTGILNTTFLLTFYGWSGSWTYYSYLPVLGLTMTIVLLPVRRNIRRIVALIAILLILISHGHVIGDIYNCWKNNVRTPQTTSTLWVQQDLAANWQKIIDLSANRQTLVMTNGWIPNLPDNFALPDAWFPEPGIPTPSEINRVKSQIEKSECLVIWTQYAQFDLWNSKDFLKYHDQFTLTWQDSPTEPRLLFLARSVH